MDSEGARLGKKLFASKRLRQWKDEGRPAPFVLSQLLDYVK
jgi:hypothetical protein